MTQNPETKIKLLKAFHGDCLLIKTYDSNQNEFIILIDGGPAKTFQKYLKAELRNINKIDLLVLTHVDTDHINGLLKFLNSEMFHSIEIKQYWFNAGNLIRIKNNCEVSVDEGIKLEEFLFEKEDKKKWGEIISYTGKKEVLASGISYQILSPTNNSLNELLTNWDTVNMEDKEIATAQVSSTDIFEHPKLNINLKELSNCKFKKGKSLKRDFVNGSSIAFTLEMLDCSLLLLGDARPEILEQTIKDLDKEDNGKVKFDMVKVSHHGSKHNSTNEFFERIDCSNYLISTNGGTGRSKHPDRETISRIVCNKERDYKKTINLFFNYSKADLFGKIGKFITEHEEDEYNFKCHYDIQEIPTIL